MGPLLATLAIITHQISLSIVNMQIQFIHGHLQLDDDDGGGSSDEEVDDDDGDGDHVYDDDDDDEDDGDWAEASHNGFPMGHNGD